MCAACLPKKNLKSAVGDRIFMSIMNSTVFKSDIPGELYALPFSITADCQGIQVNGFLWERCI